jgi:transposase
VNDYFCRWEQDRTVDHMYHAPYVQCRELAEREVSPTAAIIDSQSVKNAGKGGVCIDPHDYDAGKKIKGKKRHVLVDTPCLLLNAIVTTAEMQDRDGGILLMAPLFGLYPFLRTLYADGGHQGPQFRQAMKLVCEQINVETVTRSDAGKFVVLPKRWIVERTINWLNLCRRLAKDCECLNRNGLAFLRWASVRLMVRKLCQDRK